MVNVEVVPSPYSAPKHIVAHALSQYDKGKYDRVYCVFDRDEHTTYQEALDMIGTTTHLNTFYAITSNPCFEFWLLLHLWEEVSLSPIVRSRKKSPCKCAHDQIEQYIPEYERKKGHQETIGLIIGIKGNNISKAIERAKIIERTGESEDRENPRTLVHVLVEYLQNLKDPQKLMRGRTCQLLEEMVTTSKAYVISANYGQLQTMLEKSPILQEKIGGVLEQIEQCVNNFSLLTDELKGTIKQKIEELRR